MGLFECCHICPSTKRHPGCHAKCKDYIEQKEILSARKEALRKQILIVPPAKTDYRNNAVFRRKKY